MLAPWKTAATVSLILAMDGVNRFAEDISERSNHLSLGVAPTLVACASRVKADYIPVSVAVAEA